MIYEVSFCSTKWLQFNKFAYLALNWTQPVRRMYEKYAYEKTRVSHPNKPFIQLANNSSKFTYRHFREYKMVLNVGPALWRLIIT